MKAYILNAFGEDLKLQETTKPAPQAGEVVIAVKAIAINPVDSAMRQGYVFADSLTLPAILGCDVAGVVEAVGESVTDLSVGDRVAGLINFPNSEGKHTVGAYAEYVAAPASHVAVIPEQVDFARAAAVSAVGLTAKQALIDVAGVKADQRVLIHGGAGGVGHIAVQLAKERGAYVIATASKDHLDFVKSLGADEVIDYKNQRFEEIAHDVDVVLNNIMGDTPARSIQTLKNGGFMVAIMPAGSDAEQAAAAKNVKIQFMSVHSDGNDVAEMLDRVATGKLTVKIGATYTFDKLPEALAKYEQGGVAGKIVVTNLAK